MGPEERFEIRVLGKEGDVVSAVVETDGSVRIEPGGLFTVTCVEPGACRVTSGERVVRAYVAGTGDRRWVFVEGSAWELDVVPARTGRAEARARMDTGLSAPMPATVARILVSSGEVVQRGQTLIVLDAMKMELPIRAPRDGRVTAINCDRGELVQPGTPLLELA